MSEEKTRRQSIFKEDPAARGEGEHLSLQAYIAEHIQKKAREERKNRDPEVFNPYNQQLSGGQYTAGPAGNHINKLDVEFGEGLEHLLPTAITRYKVIRSRLGDEIADVQARLDRYMAIPHPTPETATQITAMRERLAVLRRHDAEVGGALQQSYEGANTVIQLGIWQEEATRWMDNLSGTLARWIRQTGIMGQSAEIRDLCREIGEIQDVLAEQMRRPGISAAEVSHLIVESDQKIRQLEARVLRHKPAPQSAASPFKLG